MKKNHKPFIKRSSSNPVNNNGQKGGNLRNGFRSKSAKADPNSRKLHTGVDKTGKGGNDYGNLTGRSVKSESGIHGNITKRRIEKKLKPITSNTSVRSDSSEIEKIERDKVLRKYGINPNSKSPYAKIDKTVVKSEKIFEIGDIYVKRHSPEKREKLETEENVETQIERDKYLESGLVLTREKPLEALPDSMKNLPLMSDERPTFYIGDPSEVENGFVNDKKNSNNEEEGEDNKRLESRSSEVYNGHEKYEEKTAPIQEYGTKDLEKFNEELDSKMAEVSRILNDPVNSKIVIDSVSQHLPPPTNYKEKISQLRKLAARQRDQERIQRMKKLDNSSRPQTLNTLNTKPYGFSVQLKRPLQQGVGPFGRTNVRTLNRSLDRSDTMYRSGSAELPKINYRHRLQQVITAKYDAHSSGLQAPNDQSYDETDLSTDKHKS